MPVFKTYIKIIKQNLGGIIIYFCVFAALMIAFVKNAGGGANNFQATEVPFSIIDRDQGEMGEHIKEMLQKDNKYVELKDNEQEIENELFYRRIYYVLVIPEGFTEDFMNGKAGKLQNYQCQGSFMGTFLDTQVNRYLAEIRTFITADYELDEAAGEAEKIMGKETKVSFLKGENLSKSNSAYYVYLYVPYAALAMVISGMSPVLLVFGKIDIKKRNRCSAMGNIRLNLELALGSVFYVLACFLVVNLLGIAMIGSNISLEMYGLCMLNSAAILLVSMSIAFLVGTLVPKHYVITAVANVVSLGFSFLSGIFVPISMLSDSLLRVSRFLPTYWYVIAHEALFDAVEISSKVQNQFYQCVGIQLGFAVAIFGVALVLSRLRLQRY